MLENKIAVPLAWGVFVIKKDGSGQVFGNSDQGDGWYNPPQEIHFTVEDMRKIKTAIQVIA